MNVQKCASSLKWAKEQKKKVIRKSAVTIITYISSCTHE